LSYRIITSRKIKIRKGKHRRTSYLKLREEIYKRRRKVIRILR